MTKLILVAALGVALAGCDSAADDTAVVETPAATETVAETSAGTYEFELDGVTTVSVLKPDGTYTDSQNGAVMESGTWEDRADDQTCFDPEGDDTAPTCFTIGETAADGTFVATPDNGGEPMTIKKTA